MLGLTATAPGAAIMADIILAVKDTRLATDPSTRNDQDLYRTLPVV